jgi:hypothetical protein
MSRVTCRNDENPENQANNLGHFYQNILVKIPQIFSGFLSFGQLTLDMGVFIRSMGSPVCEDIEIVMGEVYFRGT